MPAHLDVWAIVPFAVMAAIVALIVRDRMSRMPRRAPKPRRPPKPKRSHLTVVPQSKMDEELQELLKRR